MEYSVYSLLYILTIFEILIADYSLIISNFFSRKEKENNYILNIDSNNITNSSEKSCLVILSPFCSLLVTLYIRYRSIHQVFNLNILFLILLFVHFSTLFLF